MMPKGNSENHVLLYNTLLIRVVKQVHCTLVTKLFESSETEYLPHIHTYTHTDRLYEVDLLLTDRQQYITEAWDL